MDGSKLENLYVSKAVETLPAEYWLTVILIVFNG
jgi:hypothetical protein